VLKRPDHGRATPPRIAPIDSRTAFSPSALYLDYADRGPQAAAALLHQGESSMSTSIPASRRQVLKALTLGVPAALVARSGTAGAADAPAVRVDLPVSAKAAQNRPTWLFFNTDEARAIEAIVARIIPADELGPGAKEANVAGFIDQQMAGAWGAGDQFYKSGPFAQGTPQQGYQLSFTPAEMMRSGLAKLDGAVKKNHDGRAYADLDAAAQDAVLKQLEKGELDFSPVPAAGFFTALVEITVEGFFSDPVYGGNADMVGWKLIGFPGAYASYSNDIERHGQPWTRPPVSIASGPVHDMRDMASGEKK
jgi:gluconate 2-dehydrogenase gamma chain